jgi:repressor LexA
MAELSGMQKKIYDYIAECIRQQGYPPSVREICEAVDLKSPSTVHFHLKNLVEAGVIEKGAGKGRAITLTQQAFVEAPKAVSGPAYEEQADRVPIVGNVAAGSPILAEECIEEYLTFDTNGLTGEHFALRVRGESMLEAGILPGDLVIVHQQESVRNNDIVVALFEDEATVKTYRRENGHVWLYPENSSPEYQPIDGEGCSILGKVVAVIRRY